LDDQVKEDEMDGYVARMELTQNAILVEKLKGGINSEDIVVDGKII
jgi:hypothetical protein